jgi:hypothetical protein
MSMCEPLHTLSRYFETFIRPPRPQNSWGWRYGPRMAPCRRDSYYQMTSNIRPRASDSLAVAAAPIVL